MRDWHVQGAEQRRFSAVSSTRREASTQLRRLFECSWWHLVLQYDVLSECHKALITNTISSEPCTKLLNDWCV
jgi:hypothetical protein